ncbi:MAG: DUF86 domain-containing protein [Pseudonocardiaceae bacterium]
MTPRRFDPSIVQARLSVMRGLLDDLAEVATSYRESFELAEECGMIDKQLRDDLLPSVGMRNVLVHEYLEIDLQKVAAAVPLVLHSYRRYLQQVAEFVSRVTS